MSKRGLLVMLVALFVAGSAQAWKPAGWAWFSWPYAYDHQSEDWYWFNTANTQWTVGPLPGGTWQKMGATPLVEGWTYISWPYAYDWESARWYYINESDRQWCVNLLTGEWSLFGRLSTPPADNYLVIDLSAGPTALSYPVSYLASVPPGGWTDEHKTTKLVMRRIPAGTFTMGSPAGELGRAGNETQRQVALTKDFYIGVFAVTQKQWERVMFTWPSYFNNTDYRDSRPVERVSYNDIRENPNNSAISPNWPESAQAHTNSFVGKLRAKTGLTTLDLPTEAQWEYACRAGTTTALNSGTNLTDTALCPNMAAVGRYWQNGGSGGTQGGNTSVGTAAVGSYLPNAWGLYDMHGNVMEWCLDWYEMSPGVMTDPPGAASGPYRVLRGGRWSGSAGLCRSAYRGNDSPSFRHDGYGFRLSRTLP